jgi:tetratricopeptide (TPR) repeat protein
MSTYYHNHTSDLSAPMMESSVSASLNAIHSVTVSPDSSGIEGASHNMKHYQDVDEAVILLLTKLFNNGNYTALIDIAHQILLDAPNSIFVNNVLAECYGLTGENVNAIKHYENAINSMPSEREPKLEEAYLPNIYNNMAVSLKSVGLLDQSETSLKKAIVLDPKSSAVYNNYGNLMSDKADLNGARHYFLKAIEMDPSNFKAYWNLHSTVDDFDHAKDIIELCLERAPENGDAVFTLAGINAFAGDDSHFNTLMATEFSNHPILTSIKWILSLPTLPEVHFNRWSVFDRAVELSDSTRPFYEFGVWMGDSFKYLMRSFSSGYGFDTFEGLPERWGPVPKGTYSSFGQVPQIEGSEFIVGKFSETLPGFFANPKPMASLINFDADLYTSTLCALMNAKPVIDAKTILVFDEFIVNRNWENDEYRALNEFCASRGFSYEVLAISLFTKQAVIRLNPKQ